MKQFAARNGGASRASNFVFSPLSIYSALSVIATGSRGRTLSEILDVSSARCREGLLRNAGSMVQGAFAGVRHPGCPLMGYASGLWHDATRNMKPDYRCTNKWFSGVTGAVNFRTRAEVARKDINFWVATTTSDLVDSILDPGSVDKVTRLVHISALYFKGNWDRPFHKSRNVFKFHRLDTSVVDAGFMHSYEDQFVAAHDGFKVLKIPCALHDKFHGIPPSTIIAYARANNVAPPVFPRYSMCVFLPDAREGLWSLEDKMVSSPGFLHDHLPEKRVKVGKFWVPKFKVSVSISGKQVLQDLRIKAVFTTGDGMVDMQEGKPFFVNDVVHKAIIEVNEDSKEPADPNAYTTCRPEPRPGIVDFVADHPFIFFVVEEESHAILLSGYVLDPTQANTKV